jgi:hypothetical protein
MSESPWTAVEPQPGDFDGDLNTIDSRYAKSHRADPDARVRIVVSIGGEDAKRLQRVSAARGESPSELIAELLRDVDPSAV